MTCSQDAQEFDSIYAKLNSFLFLENLGSVVEIQKKSAENGFFLRIIPREHRKELCTDSHIAYKDQKLDAEEDLTNQSHTANFEDECCGLISCVDNDHEECSGWAKSTTHVETNFLPNEEQQGISKDVNGSLSEGNEDEIDGTTEPDVEAPSASKRKSKVEESYQNEFAALVPKKYQYCKMCPMVFDKVCQLVKHRQTVHREEQNAPNKTICTQCNESFPNHGAVMKHWWKVHRVNKCRDCKKVFPDSNSLKKHCYLVHDKLAKHEAAQYNCTQCDFKCTNKWTMQNHKKRIHSDKIYPCLECDKTFAQRCRLNRHVEDVHVNNLCRSNWEFECNLCLRKMPDQRRLKRHMKTRHLYSCNRCELVLPTVPARKQHGIDAHNEEVLLEEIFPNICLKCQTPISSLKEWASHKKMHEKEKQEMLNDFHCPSCDEKLDNQDEMMAHIQSVHSSDFFCCLQCKYYTRQQLAFKKHMLKKHPSTTNTYNCDLCSLEFPTIDLQLKHMREFHLKKNFCSLCQKQCKSDPKLSGTC